MKTKTIKQTAIFKAEPHEVYEALMDSKKHAEFTGATAKINRKIGGKFSVYDGGLSGTNIGLIQDKKIVQGWKCEMENWPEDHYSEATFSLKKINGGTKLEFKQTGVPTACYKDISGGWKEYYWKPMKKMLENPGIITISS